MLSILRPPLDAGADPAVSFSRDIAPLLHRRCATCHNEENAKGKFRLDTFTHLKTPGDTELPSLTAGKIQDSEIYKRLISTDRTDRMPQKADAMPAAEIERIKRWIEQGAAFDGGEEERPIVELARATLLEPAPDFYPRPIGITALAFSPDGRQIAASGYYEITIWNVADGSLARRIGGLPERITSIAWDPVHDRIAIAGGSPAQWGAVALIEPDAANQVRYLCDLPEMALSVAFRPDGDELAAGAGDRTIRLLEIPSGRTRLVLKHHADWVQSVGYSGDGQRLLSASRDRTARVVKTSNGEILTSYMGHEEALLGASFFRGDALAISFTVRNAMHLWDTHSGDRKKEIKGIRSPIQVLAADGGEIITGSADGLVRVTQAADAQTIFTLRGHTDCVQSIAFHPDRKTFATGAASGEICVWDLACGTYVRRFIASPLRGPAVDASSSGRGAP
ncbi:MAG: c-type cytochrome domain-containing protein [Chthoniobacteraceae bacterium]